MARAIAADRRHRAVVRRSSDLLPIAQGDTAPAALPALAHPASGITSNIVLSLGRGDAEAGRSSTRHPAFVEMRASAQRAIGSSVAPGTVASRTNARNNSKAARRGGELRGRARCPREALQQGDDRSHLRWPNSPVSDTALCGLGPRATVAQSVSRRADTHQSKSGSAEVALSRIQPEPAREFDGETVPKIDRKQ